MSVHFAPDTDIDRWNDAIAGNPDGGNVMQGYEFAKHKQSTGWKPLFLRFGDVAVTVLQKRVPLLGKVWYLPKGPGGATLASTLTTLGEIRSFAAKRSVFVIKTDPEIIASDAATAILRAPNRVPLAKVANIQPNVSTVLLDIKAPTDELVASFSSKTRYNIRAARKASVETRPVEATDENCTTFYRLLEETADGRFTIRSEKYYTGFWQTHDRAGTGKFFFASVGGEVVSASFVMVLGSKASRKDAASTRQRTVRGASALLEVTCIDWLKERGVTLYDLCGAPPSAEAKNKDHPHHGIGMFKTGFTDHITDFIGTYDLPVKALKYRVWAKIGERLVLKIHRTRFHESWY